MRSSRSGTWMRGKMKKQEFCSYYHVCTDGNQLPWMFKDDEDFRNGVNRLAICSFTLGLSVISFILMDNHVHFVFYGTLSQCKDFISRYKSAISRWIEEKYSISRYLSNLSSEIIPIVSEEALMETIAYIDRNSIMAGYKFLPCDYPWGSAKYMFREEGKRAMCKWDSLVEKEGVNKKIAIGKNSCFNIKCDLEMIATNKNSVSVEGTSFVGDIDSIKEVAELQVIECRSLIKSRKHIPSHWAIDQYGMIMPYCFLSLDVLNKLFVSPLRYLYFLSKKLEGKIEMVQGIKSFISDKEMRTITGTIAKEMFEVDDVKALDFESKILLARKLRYQYASTPRQVSRMLSLDVGTLSEFI